MNQILATQMGQSGVNNIIKEDYSNDASKINNVISNPMAKEKKSSSNGSTKTIIIVFAVIIILFALGLIGFKVYEMYGSKGKEEIKPEVTITPNEEGDNVSIAAKSETGINKIKYYWDENNIEAVQVNGKTEYEKMIDIPYGTNILTVIVVDINNIEHTYTQEVIGAEISGPKITLAVIQDDATVKITAEDENGIEYMDYFWDSEEPKRLEPATEEENTIVETTIEVLKGTHTLTVISVNKLGKESKEVKKFAGKNKPEVLVSKHGEFIDITVKHENGIKKIEVILNNGEPFVYDEHFSGFSEVKTQIDFPDVQLVRGKNNVKINAYSMDDTVTNYEGECEYIP